MDKRGVFISHITQERATAFLLKDYLQRVFSLDLPIFVSSDYESIGGGDVWFTRIVEALKNAAVVIVLLSPDSLERRWIDLEAGVGVGAEGKVIPVVIHGLERGKVGHPLTSLQIRSLENMQEVNALVQDIAKPGGRIPKALIDANGLIALATQRMPGSGWVGVDFNGSFLAVDGPLFKLQGLEDQVYIDTQAEALKRARFKTSPANMYDLSRTIALGYKIVYVTDKKTYRARLTGRDVVLVAKPDGQAT
jgi:hypothetical protein